VIKIESLYLIAIAILTQRKTPADTIVLIALLANSQIANILSNERRMNNEEVF